MKQTLFSFVPTLLSLAGPVAAAGLTNSSLETYVDVVTLSNNFNPVKAAYWTGYVHHRRTPFAVSPSGSAAYLAYLDGSETGVHVQPVDPTTFKATGTVVTVSGGKEAGGLVAQDDGFALLTNEALPSGTTDAPPDNTPVPVLYRFDASGTQLWKTWLGGPNVTDSEGLMAAPDLNGDLVYSNSTGRYAAYTVVTAYSGDADGHYGDAIRYVEDSTGEIVVIEGASSDWGCSHNTGIALEAADAAPYASVCAEDQGAIWLNTNGQGMYTDSAKVSNENTTNGADGEPLGGMSGSYSNLARFQSSDEYIFAWVSRGAKDLTENTWMGTGYTNAQNRTNGRNVAIAVLTDKYTLADGQATSEVGAASGDSQVNWATTSTTADQSNAHVATFDDTHALVTWEEIADPFCEYIAMGCRGVFTGAYYQLVSKESNGTLVGEPLVSNDVFVAGDMVTMGDGRVCWPYVSMDWDLSGVVDWTYTPSNVTKMSFACISLNGSSSTSSAASSSSATPAATSTKATVASSAASSSAAVTAAVSSSSVPLAVAAVSEFVTSVVASSSEVVPSSAVTVVTASTESIPLDVSTAKGAETEPTRRPSRPCGRCRPLGP
ncbi:hypothetical protein VPNG_07525 [Cytospora leucostoma]|uniref:Phytase-like domain-containing protein n=1 Tax=Cytospora leucostoma TaxID=1230097 RepID=A0A423WS88_9PEZI|nr:hypothetical protein VPNG_07525 [Cytospora leucostoma]